MPRTRVTERLSRNTTWPASRSVNTEQESWIMATFNTEQRRTGLRSWGRGRWALVAIIVIAIIVVAIVLMAYTGGSSGGGGGGGY